MDVETSVKLDKIVETILILIDRIDTIEKIVNEIAKVVDTTAQEVVNIDERVECLEKSTDQERWYHHKE